MIYVKLFIAALFWSVTFYFTKIALAECSLTTLILTRCALGLLVVALVMRSFKWLAALTKTDWLKLFFLAFTGILVQQYVQGYGILHTSTSHAGWLNALSPVFVAVIMVLFFDEKLGKVRSLGFLVAFIGIVGIFLSKQSFTDGSMMHTGRGDLIFIFTSFNWALYVVPMSLWFKNTPTVRLTFCIFLISVIVLLPVEFVSGAYRDFFLMSPKALGSIVYLGLCCSGISFLFYNEGVDKIGAAKASAFLYIQPVFTTIFGYLLLGEMINKITFVGGALVMLGLYMINIRRQHVRKFYITLIRYFRM